MHRVTEGSREWRLVTGCGAVAFTGPLTLGVCTIQRTISIQSRRWIHETYCRPDPIGPPTKNLNGAHHFRQRPARSFEHHAGAQKNDARAWTFGLARFLLPVRTELRQEIRARRHRSRCVVDRPTVRSSRRRCHSPGPPADSSPPRIADARLRVARMRLSLIRFFDSSDQRFAAERLAGEVDDGVCAFERRPPMGRCCHRPSTRRA